MKRLFTLILFILSLSLYAQDSYRPFVGSDINDANIKIERTTSKMRLVPKGEQEMKTLKDGSVLITRVYQKFNDPEKQLKIQYHTTPNNHKLFINHMSATGDEHLLIQYFVKQWDTEISVDLDQAISYTRNFLTDEVTIRLGSTSQITVD